MDDRAGQLPPMPMDALGIMQEYVRNINNQIFLSEHQLNGLYPLLLLTKAWPWDSLNPNHHDLKGRVDELLTHKTADVGLVLGNLLRVYETKMKSSNFGWIEKFMGILKASTKNIYIHRVFKRCPSDNHLQPAVGNQHPRPQDMGVHACYYHHHPHETTHHVNQLIQQHAHNHHHHHHHPHEQEHKHVHQHKHNHEVPNAIPNSNAQMSAEPKPQQGPPETATTPAHNINVTVNDQVVQEPKNSGPFDNQLLGVFYGISNIGALGGLGMTKCLEYNSSERYITFKMGEKYNITVKNEDPIVRDETSMLSRLPRQTFVHHIFPYLNASELFGMRAVCKVWSEYVRETWHSTFRREMLSQLLASDYCKEIEFHYKLLQLRNPFYQKISLLLHALIEIIQWEIVTNAIDTDTITLPLKRVLVVLLKLIGEQDIALTHINDITEQVWTRAKPKARVLKQLVSAYFANSAKTVHSVADLKGLKLSILDHPFMRVEQMHSEDKTPLLLSIFIKQFLLQSILKNHIILTQEYLLNAKKRLDEISRYWPQNRNFLEVAYKILLTRSSGRSEEGSGLTGDKDEFNNLDFSALLKSALEGTEEDQFAKADFVIRSKGTVTNVFLDRRTKLDIIVSTFRKTSSGLLDEAPAQQLEPEKRQDEQEQPSERKPSN